MSDRWVRGIAFFVLLDFTALTAWAVASVGVSAIPGILWDAHTTNPFLLQIFADLVLALLMCCLWMWRDARRRGAAFWPYFALTLALGSIGPLLYLALRRAPAEELAAEGEALRPLPGQGA